MSFHMKCVKHFILLCTLFCVTQSFGNDLANIVGESGEDESLREALLLVELLKNEYARALRENFVLRQRMAQPTTVPPEEPTCASTKLTSSRVPVAPSTRASRATTTRRPLTTGPASSARRSLGSVPPIHPDITRRKAILNNRSFRRRMPSNYLFGSDALKSLRRQEEGEVSEEPATSETPEVATEAEAVAQESDASTASPETTPAAADTVAADATTEAPKSENSVKNKDDPVLSQVADELMSEMKSDKKLQITKTTLGRSRKTTRNTRYLSAIKPTLKIHLSKSTRLAVPFSKNHAFCYHNPKNALCRTSV